MPDLGRLILRGARVVDPATSLDDIADVAILDGVIDATGNVSASESDQVLDLSGRIVTPGLIDAHVHVYKDVSPLGVDPDDIGVGMGVTTVVDAGSAGATTLRGLLRHVASRARTRVLCYLNYGALGNIVGEFAELSEPWMLDAEGVREAVSRNHGVIRGVKVRAIWSVVRELGIEPILQAKGIARELDLPLVVHLGEPRDAGTDRQPLTRRVLSLLEPGDIVAHWFTARLGGILGDDGNVLPEAVEAYRRGVLADVGHGMNNFSYEVFHRIMDQGLGFHTISSDVTALNRSAVGGLVGTMNRFLALGLSLPEVIAKTTVAPAQALRLAEGEGTLLPGSRADLSILKMIDRDTSLQDSEGESLTIARGLIAVGSIAGGRIAWTED